MSRRPRIYVQQDPAGVIPLVASGTAYPVNPPDEWFQDPQLDGPTPLTVTADGRVYGHIASFNTSHIGLPGNRKPPRSASGYKFFRTGVIAAASGKDIPVGQLTLAGGHAPLSASADQAVKHYDDTASAVVDVAAGDDRHGIWVAGALRPDVSPTQVRALRASAPSGDWRPINGQLELVACCQVNVPGFPLAREMVASGGQVTALVAAGAYDMAVLRYTQQHEKELALRVTELESMVASLTQEQTRAMLRKKVHGR